MSQGQWLGTLLLLPGKHLASTTAAAPRPAPAPTAGGHPARAAGPDTGLDTDPFASILHRHPGMQDTVRRARQLSSARTAVLLHGETGAGKEAFARGLHGGRPGAFIALNCGGLARDLLASELFGHAEGAFTGARKGGMPGKIEAAQDGTLFLDEIGEMPLDMQPMLLRVLEQGEVCRLGENRLRRVNFRLVAATHRDLREEVAAGRFRMDLYYRIAVTSLRIPPLRERGDDVLLLARHYLAHFRQQAHLPPTELPPHVAQRLLAYAWPGNVRELRNAIESAVLLSGNGPLTLESLPPELQDLGTPATATATTSRDASPRAPDPACHSAADGAPNGAPHGASACTIRHAQAQAIRAAIDATGGNLTQAARQLGIAKSTLYEKMKRYGLQR
ncbi:MAG: sigma 54-interacting transcriptional regulator [Pseudomonadota bacterium]|nr:sigma 54-interacting transcriptional regulator [Pseudomonadota bacterium]